MELSELTSISAIDGRYRTKTQELAPFFSEYGYIRYRILVEIEYFIMLCEIPLPALSDFPEHLKENLRDIYRNFSPDEAVEVKKIESVTNHDVKSVEYFLGKRFDEMDIGSFKPFIHFGLTSQDINNTALPAALKDFHHTILIPLINQVVEKLGNLALEWKSIPMLAKTHGQPASPTLLGKEIMVFKYRIEQQLEMLGSIPFSGKFGGATGNFNAHHIAYPGIDWNSISNIFLQERLGLARQQFTTQIENYDHLSAYFDSIRRINTILTDLCRDIWMYISMNYFRQRISEKEVGSSTMPHKVNPIDFENAEGNLGISNALLDFFSQKLPISRLQRDLTDSTVVRNIGSGMGHSILAYKSLLRGLSKLIVNKEVISEELEQNQAVVAEAIQTILRREAVPNAYELLKSLTRVESKITKESIHHFIESLPVKREVKDELLAISPHNYFGINPFGNFNE